MTAVKSASRHNSRLIAPRLQGVRITEDAIALAVDKHMEALKNGAFYDGDLGVCAYTYAEDWQQNCSCGRLNA